MTESTDKQPGADQQEPEATQPKPATPAPKPPRSGRWLAALALLIGLLALAAAAGGGYYLWQQLQQLAANQQTLASEAALERRAEQLAATATELQRDLSTVSKATDAASDALENQQQQLAELQQAQQTVRERLGQLDVETQARQGEWLRAEAVYLARLAITRLEFQRDVDSALAALKLADELLARLNSRTVEERQAVHRAINRLVKVDLPDTPDLMRRIDNLLAGIDGLPLAQQLQSKSSQQQPPQPEESTPTDWQDRLQRAWGRFKDTLGQLVIVQRGEPAEPLLAPEEGYFLSHNLRLQLEAARLALLEGNADIYQRSLQRSGQWLRHYYLADQPQVAAMLTEISALQAIDIHPDLPDLAPVLEPVIQY